MLSPDDFFEFLIYSTVFLNKDLLGLQTNFKKSARLISPGGGISLRTKFNLLKESKIIFTSWNSFAVFSPFFDKIF